MVGPRSTAPRHEPRARSRGGAASGGFTLIEILAVLAFFVLLILLLQGGEGVAGISELEIVPNVADVESGAKFRLEVRPKDDEGRVIRDCDCYVIEWEIDPPGALRVRTSESPHWPLVEAETVPDLLPVAITARVGKVEATAEFTIVPRALAAGEDRLEADHAAGPIEVGLVSWTDQLAVSDPVDAPHPFVGFKRLGVVPAGQGRVALFSADRELGFSGNSLQWPGTAIGNGDVVSASNAVSGFHNLPKGGPLQVELHIWIARQANSGNPVLATAIARGDVRLANDILRRNRVGLEFTISGGNPQPLILQNPVNPDPCQDLSAFTVAPPPPRPAADPGAAINVVYILGQAISYPGLSCTAAKFVFLEGEEYQPTFLIHELAHQLWNGTSIPFQGHIRQYVQNTWKSIPGLAYNNFMGATDHYRPILQDYVSLGQAFRLIADANGFLNTVTDPATGAPIRAGRPTASCQAGSETDQPCPRLCSFVPPAINAEAESCDTVPP